MEDKIMFNSDEFKFIRMVQDDNEATKLDFMYKIMNNGLSNEDIEELIDTGLFDEEEIEELVKEYFLK